MMNSNYPCTAEEKVVIRGSREENAWAGCLDGNGDEWWKYLEVDVMKNRETGDEIPVVTKETIWSCRCIDVGTITYNPEPGTILIALRNGWKLKDTQEPVKIQGYDNLPCDTPLPGLFKTYKGSETIVAVGKFRYFAIHLDIKNG